MAPLEPGTAASTGALLFGLALLVVYAIWKSYRIALFLIKKIMTPFKPKKDL